MVCPPMPRIAIPDVIVIMTWMWKAGNTTCPICRRPCSLIRLTKLNPGAWNGNVVDLYYRDCFANLPGLDLPVLLPGVKQGHHLFTIWVPPQHRDAILWELQQKGVGVAVNYRACHLYSLFRNQYGYKEGDLPASRTYRQPDSQSTPVCRITTGRSGICGRNSPKGGAEPGLNPQILTCANITLW